MNDETLVDPIVKVRLDIIHVPNYSREDQINIIRNHMLPELTDGLPFQLCLEDDIINQTIWRYYDEKGSVRQLKSLFEQLIARLNRLYLSGDDRLESCGSEIKVPTTLATDIFKEMQCSKQSNMTYKDFYG